VAALLLGLPAVSALAAALIANTKTPTNARVFSTSRILRRPERRGIRGYEGRVDLGQCAGMSLERARFLAVL
jgi:hypothetical protein